MWALISITQFHFKTVHNKSLSRKKCFKTVLIHVYLRLETLWTIHSGYFGLVYKKMIMKMKTETSKIKRISDTPRSWPISWLTFSFFWVFPASLKVVQHRDFRRSWFVEPGSSASGNGLTYWMSSVWHSCRHCTVLQNYFYCVPLSCVALRCSGQQHLMQTPLWSPPLLLPPLTTDFHCFCWEKTWPTIEAGN